MPTITLHFQIPRTKLPCVFALMEAEGTPLCELRVRKSDTGARELEITTAEENAGYFRGALGAEIEHE